MTRPPTAQEWIAQNAPQPPGGPVPPFPFPLPTPAPTAPPRGSQGPSSLAWEQLYGPGSEGLLADVVDNPEFSQEHRDLAWAVLAGDKPMKKLVHEDRNLLDEIAHQLAGTTPKGHRPIHKPSTPAPVRFDEGTSFTQGPDEDFDPDMAYEPSDSDKRG